MSTAPDSQPAATTAPLSPKAVTVDDVLVALQKTFSRVSARSASVGAGAARALVTGNVQFDISIPVAFDGDSQLIVAPAGGQPLRLNGQIATDVRVVAHGDTPAAPAVASVGNAAHPTTT